MSYRNPHCDFQNHSVNKGSSDFVCVSKTQASTPHKRGARKGQPNVSGLSWKACWGPQGTKHVKVGDLILFRVTAWGKVIAVRK